jgi:hypothetical protein
VIPHAPGEVKRVPSHWFLATALSYECSECRQHLSVNADVFTTATGQYCSRRCALAHTGWIVTRDGCFFSEQRAPLWVASERDATVFASPHDAERTARLYGAVARPLTVEPRQ